MFADPADIASTAGVGFTISRVAAVAIPAALDTSWLVSPAAVFLASAGTTARDCDIPPRLGAGAGRVTNAQREECSGREREFLRYRRRTLTLG